MDVAPEDWASFLKSFTRQHQGWLASISVTRKSEKPVQVGSGRLEGLTIHRSHQGVQIHISVLGDGKNRLNHVVVDPAHLRFKRDAMDAHEGVDIVSGDGSLTTVLFRVAARPETLDGVLPRR